MVEFDEKRIDALFSQLNQCHLPGVAVGIAIGGRPVYRKGFGLANIELPMALSPTIRMAIFSITKHFTCLAYLLLCEEGRAGIDDALGQYLPELHPVARAVTARQLMSNTSGLRDASAINWQFSGVGLQIKLDELLEPYRTIDEVNFAPNTSWCYNNGGFLLLSKLIERIAGQPFHEVLRERIFTPIGMHDTLLRRFDTDYLPNCAANHMVGMDGGYEKAFLGAEIAGAGGMISTVDDMLRWLAHMDAPRVGSAATWKVMKTPHVLNNGTSTGYGLGLITSEYRGVQTLFHAGGGVGGNAQMLKIPSAGLDVVVMTNRQDVFATPSANQIVDVCLTDLSQVNQEVTRHFSTGVYYSANTGRVVQLYESGGEQIVSIDTWERPVAPGPDGALWPTPVHAYLKQPVKRVGDTQHPSSVLLDDFGTTDEFLAVPSVADNIEIPAARYRSPMLDIEVDIIQSSDGPHLRTIGPRGRVDYRLEPIAANLWRASSRKALPATAIVRFEHDHSAFRFSANRNSLLFQRL